MKMSESTALKELQEKIDRNFKLSDKEKKIVEKVLSFDLNLDRINAITNLIIDTRLDNDSLVAFLVYQLYSIFLFL